jgi:hypothetical protein
VPSPTNWVQGAAVSLNTNILNNTAGTYTGTYSADLYDLSGNFVENIGTITESTGLPAGFTYVSPYLTFSKTAVTSAPGTYFLAITEQATGSGSYYLVGGDLHTNPIYINIVGPPVAPDIYEADDAEATAHHFTESCTGGTCSTVTTGSNFHVGTDNDYYIVDFPWGYDYVINPRLNDSYSSVDGHTYTVDALFSYKGIGGTWSDNFDDVISAPIYFYGGGTLMFHVAPYFAGNTGTYVLDVAATRVNATGIDELHPTLKVEAFPNPVQDELQLVLNHSFDNTANLIISDALGNEVMNIPAMSLSDTRIKLDVSKLQSGMYFVTLRSDLSQATTKFIKAK